MKTTTLPITNSMNSSPLRHAFLLAPLVLVCFGLSPIAQAADGDLGKGNTAEGSGALQSLTTGIHNTALGAQTLFSNSAGNFNTATGSQALKNSTGNNNTADGFQALFFNTTGFENAATGWRALFHNTTGFHNTANGFAALFSTTSGNHNTADGDLALVSNTTGNFNTTAGAHSLALNTTGNLNIVLGFFAGQNLTTGSNNIDVANGGVAAESDTIRIGNEVAVADLEGIMHPAHTKTFIAGISGATVSGGVAVFVNSSGQLGTMTSSERFKDEIKPMDKTSEAILALKPVTFRYKQEIDPKSIPQFGLVAEEVEKVNPALITRDAKGEVYTVRYEAVNAMLLNEFLKEHRTVQELKSTVAKQEATAAEQQKEIKVLTASLKEQAAQIQKVSAQLEASKPAPQVVNNNQ